MDDVLNQDRAGTVEEAAQLLMRGRLVAFPTETVYGLGGDATNGHAIAAIYEVKGRPRFNPLIVHVPDIENARQLACFDERADALASAFWPGPLTLVLPKREDCPVADLATAGLNTIALRIPAHPLALQLLRETERPLAAPSANPSGAVSPTTAQHVADGLGDRVDLILDGGRCEVGVESTIIGLMPGSAPKLLRPGGIARTDLEAVLGKLDAPSEGITAPGQTPSHYAPAAHLRLNAAGPRKGEALLAFGPHLPAVTTRMLNLSETRDLREAAANLFGHLRTLDAEGHARIAVMSIPDAGLGEAINDRLRRAAAPRSLQPRL